MGDISRGLVPPHHILSTFGDGQVRITAKDLLTVLLVDEKLNDDVMNFYMALLGSTACMTRQTSSGLRVFSFSFFFFTKLQLHGHSGVERWPKNVDLLHFDLIFVPMHKDNDHWILLFINLRGNVFEIFDSYPPVIADSRFYLSVFELIVQYLERHTSYGQLPGSWESMAGNVTVEGVPRQVDGASCGVFMLMFATLLQHGDRPPFRFSSEDISVIRRQLATCLLEHHCLWLISMTSLYFFYYISFNGDCFCLDMTLLYCLSQCNFVLFYSLNFEFCLGWLHLKTLSSASFLVRWAKFLLRSFLRISHMRTYGVHNNWNQMISEFLVRYDELVCPCITTPVKCASVQFVTRPSLALWLSVVHLTNDFVFMSGTFMNGLLKWRCCLPI